MDVAQSGSRGRGIGAQAASSLEKFRSYLLLLAQWHLDPRIQAKVSPSDLVQRTLHQANLSYPRFKERRGEGQVAWLRKILLRNVLKASRDLHRQKRDIARERSLDLAMESSSRLLVDRLADSLPSPEEQAVREELLQKLSDALLELPEDQREALLLHYLGDLSTAEIGERLDRTRTAVAGLISRGLKALRGQLRERAP